MYRRLLFIICISFVISCNNKDSESSETVWIGGEVINPKTDYIVLYKDNCILDTVKLNSRNFFLYENHELQEGLYSFQHNEFQIFYVEPGDSLMLRVNTVDFDESLTYTGKGAEKNNFLMELFLINEEENKLVPKWYSLPPATYEQKLDSLKQIREQLYSEFVSKYDPSKGLKQIAKANIEYDYYSKKEMYTSVNASNPENSNPQNFPKDFYAYRDKIDFGNDNLRSYYPYYRFLNRYFDNIAATKYSDQNATNKYSYIHCERKFKIIDSLVTSDSLKNNLLRSCIKNYLINGKDAQNEQLMVALFLKMNNNKMHHTEIQKLAEATINLTPGNKIPNVLIVSTDNTAKDLRSTISKPTVLYFWSGQSVKHYRDIHSKAAELKAKYPEYDFIGINTDTHFKKWRDIVKKSGYNADMEYQLENIEEAEAKLVINSINKAMILTKNAVILESNANLFSTSIEGLLLGYLN
ncbi:thioredoxin-like domain-containing protein [Ulvibacter sp. MAR_2010_11]|uniref:TlpA family protein disulfide reductase n=1 Tax=Ulvibacter sp. MAR_2010_11 TaxID=1250229 RepID=UPI000C2C3B2B|nr:thioredoxin-like domain-containing protein [Ulvibacter sp. MAR_2010_11]